jgi:hypothetical protein
MAGNGVQQPAMDGSGVADEGSGVFREEGSGRGERIRTSGLYVPNVALYRAKLHPDGNVFAAAGRSREAKQRKNRWSG